MSALHGHLPFHLMRDDFVTPKINLPDMNRGILIT